jgi:hypothetical protein
VALRPSFARGLPFRLLMLTLLSRKRIVKCFLSSSGDVIESQTKHNDGDGPPREGITSWPVSGEPPSLHGVKSPSRLARTSGGIAIVEVRPAGELARTSCSAQELPSPELDPASLRRKSRASNDAVASFAGTGHCITPATTPLEPSVTTNAPPAAHHCP